jgi:hypothetical protein
MFFWIVDYWGIIWSLDGAMPWAFWLIQYFPEMCCTSFGDISNLCLSKAFVCASTDVLYSGWRADGHLGFRWYCHMLRIIFLSGSTLLYTWCMYFRPVASTWPWATVALSALVGSLVPATQPRELSMGKSLWAASLNSEDLTMLVYVLASPWATMFVPYLLVEWYSRRDLETFRWLIRSVLCSSREPMT